MFNRDFQRAVGHIRPLRGSQGKNRALNMLAHPKNPALIAQNLIAVPDAEGRLFRKEIVEKAKSKGSGWVDYVYLNPETNRQEHKTTYLQKEGDVIICCGVYKDYSHDGD